MGQQSWPTLRYCCVNYLDTLSDRAATYGGTLADILELTPVELWDSPTELKAFWDVRDLSHVFPQSTNPELATVWSNIIAEDSSVNRSRGAKVMTDAEQDAALADAQADAELIDLTITDDSEEFLDEVLELIA